MVATWTTSQKKALVRVDAPSRNGLGDVVAVDGRQEVNAHRDAKALKATGTTNRGRQADTRTYGSAAELRFVFGGASWGQEGKTRASACVFVLPKD